MIGELSYARKRLSVRSLWGLVRGYPLQVFFVYLGGITFIQMDQALFVYAATGFKQDLRLSIKGYGLIVTIGFVIGGLLAPVL